MPRVSSARLLSLAPLVATAALQGRLDAYSNLFDFYRSHPGFSTAAISVGPSGLGGGAGLFLTSPVAKGELVASVPVDACVRVADTWVDPECGTLLQKISERRGEVPALAGWLAKQRVCGDQTAFLDVIPWEKHDEPTHVLWWTDAEVAAHLRGSALEEAEQLRREAATEIKLLRRALMPGVQERLFLSEQFDEEKLLTLADDFGDALRAAFVAVCSRAFAVERGDDDGGTNTLLEPSGQTSYTDAPGAMLIPLLDALQHGYPGSITHGYESTRVGPEGDPPITCYACRATVDLPAGHELLNDYGAGRRPDAELAISYGFAPNCFPGSGEEAKEGKGIAMASPTSCAARLQLPWDSTADATSATTSAATSSATGCLDAGAFDSAKLALLRSWWLARHSGDESDESGGKGGEESGGEGALCFQITYAQLDLGAGAGGSAGAGGPLGALLAAARWAAITPADVAQSGLSIEDLAQEVLSKGVGVGAENAARAASSIRLAAAGRLDELGDLEQAGKGGEEEESDNVASRRAMLGVALRRSEAAALSRLAADAEVLLR